MRLGYWTDDIADPSEIASYFGYYPQHRRPSIRAGTSRPSTRCSRPRSRNSTPPSATDQYARMQAHLPRRSRPLPLYESPYPVVLKKSVHGFLQIPLGNNIFSGRVAREVSPRVTQPPAGPVSRAAPRTRRGPVLSAGYVLRRILQMVPTLVFILVVTFVLVRLLPGDPAERHRGRPRDGRPGGGRPGPPTASTSPLPAQFLLYVRRVVTGDLGRSHRGARAGLVARGGSACPPTMLLSPAWRSPSGSA